MSTAIAKNFQIGADSTPSNNFTLYQPASPDGTLRLGNGNTGITSSLLTLTSAGNLGLGVTPSAWSGATGFQLANGAFVGAAGRYFYIGANTHFNGSWRYTTSSGGAARYDMDGSHAWFVAPSGTAGNAISFTQAMTLDASGNLGIGTSSPVQRLEVVGNVDITTVAANGNGLRIRTPSGSGSPAILQFTNNPVTAQWAYISASAANVMSFGGATEYVRINATDFQFNSGYGSVATAYGCRAWVNFNGTGTVAIRGSGNVSSITDNGVGDYTVNFVNAMPDANYAVTSSFGGTSGSFGVATLEQVTARTTSAFRVATFNSGGGGLDVVQVNFAIVR